MAVTPLFQRICDAILRHAQRFASVKETQVYARRHDRRFWTGEKAAIESDFPFLLNSTEGQDSDKLAQIEAFLKNLRSADTPQTALDASGYSDSAETPFSCSGFRRMQPDSPFGFGMRERSESFS